MCLRNRQLTHNQAFKRTPKTPRLLRNVLRTFYCAKPAPFRAPLNLALGPQNESLFVFVRCRREPQLILSPTFLGLSRECKSFLSCITVEISSQAGL